MNKKNTFIVKTEPYHYNPAITVEYEMVVGKDEVVPGTLLKLKGSKSVYSFRQKVHNADLNVTWIDVHNNTTGGFRAFYVDRLQKVVKPKKKRVK